MNLKVYFFGCKSYCAEGEYDVNNGLSPCAMHPSMQCILVSSRTGGAG